MGVLLSILGAIAGIAVTIGATSIADKIETTINYGNKVDSDTILNSINSLIAIARNKGSNALNIVNNRLNALQLPLGVSPAVKDIITDKRRELANLAKQTQKNVNEVETTLSNAEQRANLLASQPESVRTVVGKTTSQKIKNDLTPALEKADNIEKEIEQYVSKKN